LNAQRARQARLLACAACAIALADAAPAAATIPGTFGHGPRSAGLAQSDVADGDASNAGEQNPALAASPGLRLRLGYSYGALSLELDDREIGPSTVSGIDMALQYGRELGRDVVLGLALEGHVPDRHIARVAFRPATEPQFVRYEASLARTSLDTVAALAWRGFSIGGGVSATLDVAGEGTDFTLGQDGSGTYADAATDVELPYRLAPLVGARADLGPVVLGAQFRGALGVDLRLVAVNTIALVDNPLNGSTTVLVNGTSGYDPAVIDIGARVALGAGLSAHLAFEYAVWSAAPSPAADVSIEVLLRTSPTLREARFSDPRFRDTISPRFGLELLRGDAPAEGDDAPGERAPPKEARGRAAPPAPRDRPVRGLFGETMTGAQRWRYALRAGYVLSPSPVPAQTGLTSYADATRHGMALGGAVRVGRWAGVDVAVGLAGQLHLLVERSEEKPNPSLPYARYDVSGNVFFGSFGVEATWR
jgi:opacity protein-like surface antigen